MWPSDDIKVLRVPARAIISATRVPAVWNLLMRGLAAAGETDLRLVLADLLTEHKQLWIIFGDGEARPLAVWVTGIRHEGDGPPFLCVSYLAGRKMRKWVRPMAETMTQYAARQKCASVRWAGKLAWARAVPGARITGRISDTEAFFERPAA
jgi:hypothetical protein